MLSVSLHPQKGNCVVCGKLFYTTLLEWRRGNITDHWLASKYTPHYHYEAIFEYHQRDLTTQTSRHTAGWRLVND
jgi:hypothetical protein